jgi:hypothetical protein
MGKLVMESDAQELRRLQEGFKADGMSANEATLAAVDALMSEARAERAEVLDKVRAAGGDEEREIKPRASVPQFNLMDHNYRSAEDNLREWFGESVVSHEHRDPRFPAGDPRHRTRSVMMVYHAGTFDPSEDGVISTSGLGAHFGTQQQAAHRFSSGFEDRARQTLQVYESVDENGNSGYAFEYEGPFGTVNSDIDLQLGPFETAAHAESIGVQDIGVHVSDAASAHALPAQVTEAYLRIENPLVLDDHGTWEPKDILLHFPIEALEGMAAAAQIDREQAGERLATALWTYILGS